MPIDLAPSYIDRLREGDAGDAGEGGGEGKRGGGERDPAGDIGESVRASDRVAMCEYVREREIEREGQNAF